MTRMLLAILLLLGSASTSAAIEVDGVSFPDLVEVNSTPLLVNGTGIRAATIFNIHVYVAALYLTAKSGDAAAIVADPSPKRLVMEFKRAIGKEDMRIAWRKSFALNNADADARLGQLEDFISILGDMEPGSRVVITFTSRGVTLECNGATKSVEDPGFAAAVLRIWLGEAPPDKNLQSGLLGKG